MDDTSEAEILGVLFLGGLDDATLDQRLVGLLGSKLLGSLDGIVDGRLLRFAVDQHLRFVMASRAAALHERTYHLERDLSLVLLAPVDELALIVPIAGRDGVDVEVGAEQLVDDDPAGEAVAFFEIHGAHEGLEGVALERLESATRIALIVNQLGKAHLVGQLVETGAADDLRSHDGEVAFALIGILLVQEFGDDGAEDGVAQILQALVVDAVALLHLRVGAVDESDVVELRPDGDVAQHILKEPIESRRFCFLAEQRHRQNFLKARQTL